MWKLTPGGASGYRYKLQNNDLGVIVLFGSKHNKIDLDKPEFNVSANHFKVELSPHFILARTSQECDEYVDNLVKQFLDSYDRPKLAAHLCADFKGACKSAELKLIRFKAKRAYQPNLVREQIELALNTSESKSD